MWTKSILALAFAGLTLTACDLPRGAALQSEIVDQANTDAPEIAVHQVTRAFLDEVDGWPAAQKDHFRWLRHAHGATDPVIQPFDKLSIVIWDSEPNSLLTSEAERLVSMPDITVNAAGAVFLPYVGEIRVADRTATAARRQLQREMEAIVPSAQVQLSRTGGTRTSVSMVSGMANPGSYPITDGHTTVLNVLSMAGGPSDLRNPVVRLTRSGQNFTIPLQTLYEEASADSIVRGGDKISVSADPRYFRALGAAGSEQLVDFDRAEITALDAMSMIGGLEDNTANPKGVLVLREYPASAVRGDGSGPAKERVVFAIDLTSSDGLFSAGKFPIEHKDTVLVTESPVNTVRVVFQLVGSAFGLANAATGG